MGEDAGSASEQELPRRVQNREHREPDPADGGRRAVHTSQEQMDDAAKSGTKIPIPMWTVSQAVTFLSMSS
jgi:hypothetical protein